MINFLCYVQEGIVSEEQKPKLASGLSEISTSILGGTADDVEVKFVVIPKGSGFRGGELSTTSTVRGTIPDGCDKETREKLLASLCDMWVEELGGDEDEVIVSARDEGHFTDTIKKFYQQ